MYSPYRTLKKFSLFIAFVSFIAMVLLILSGCSVKVDWFYPGDESKSKYDEYGYRKPPGT